MDYRSIFLIFVCVFGVENYSCFINRCFPQNEGCVYDKGICCSMYLCVVDMSLCELYGKEYNKNSEVYQIGDQCVECWTQCRLNGENHKPFCQKIKCGASLFQIDKLINNCAPVFFNAKNQCCPDTYVCASIKIKKEELPDYGIYCRFGNKTYKLGASFVTIVRDNRTFILGDKIFRTVTCTCESPPFFYCVPLDT